MNRYTDHGAQRAQQRGIPPIVIDWLQAYGRDIRSRGADIYYFDKSTKKTLKRDLGSQVYSAFTEFLNIYVVISDEGAVITTGIRTKRLKCKN
jgi:hypothetical protein